MVGVPLALWGNVLLWEKGSSPSGRSLPLRPLLPLLLLQGPLPPLCTIPILQYNTVCEIHTPCQSSSWPGLTGFLMQSRVPLGFSHRPSQARREATIRRTHACPQTIFAWLVERSPKGLRDPSEGPDLEGLGFWEHIGTGATLTGLDSVCPLSGGTESNYLQPE